MTVKIYVEQFPNKSLREVHVSIPFAKEPYSKYDEKRPVPKKVKRLERAIEKLAEITNDFDAVRRKSIRIERNPTFTWEETQAAVINVIARYFKQDVSVEVQERETWMDRSELPVDY